MKHQQKGMLHQWKSGMCLQVGACFALKRFEGSGRIPVISFFLESMRGVVGSNQVEPVIRKCFPERFTVFRCFNCRITFDLIPQAFVVVGTKVEVMNTDLGCDAL